ncbi:MAG: hypothetical protein AAF703_15745 [Cyanobacteria bacterium P01_D01_bin.105]
MPDWGILVIAVVSAVVGVLLGALLIPSSTTRSRSRGSSADQARTQRSVRQPSYTNLSCDEATLSLSDLFHTQTQTSASQLKASSKALLSFFAKDPPGRRIFNDVLISAMAESKDQTMRYREQIGNEATEKLSETTMQQEDNRLLILTTRRTISNYPYKATHKIIYSPLYDKTYRLSISVLLLGDREEQYASEVANILDSFKVAPPSVPTATQ